MATVPLPAAAAPSLRRAIMAWGWIAVVGQLLFLGYIIALYAPPLVTGDFIRWSRGGHAIDAYVPGDRTGNIQFGLHILLAAILTLGGLLQLSPRLRARLPAVHRWNGRLFVVAAILASLGGLWLVWVRGSRLNMASATAITLNAALILAFVILAVAAARRRDFAGHRRWALRAFLAVSGVWFLRVGMMAFALIGIGLLGLPKQSAQAFFAVWSFGSTLVPLLLLELTFRATGGAQRALSYGFWLLSALTAVGIAGAAALMWWPHL
ncbi:DUF2306 domain-containing protein [Sandaracinobacteroides saxicola]|uniref:DUF2306 domain-containing protein n=1 Tax=Sandaracinobacteroides saxicola TaxID=2759707 RepID=A0A7G5IEX0_9SPHN|nr:DUF2306 domain-containing protein [Sandaracinobacteroides saxicola]QMW21912.1 DUF2306 domain-containing protein [Sandaracinobacteroides saxicola]